MELKAQTDILEPQRSTSASAASNISNKEIKEDELPNLVQQPAQSFSPDIVSAASKESENTSQRSQRKTNIRHITGIQVQPIRVSLAFSEKSTLRGTPWEEALGGVTQQTGNRSKKAGKPTQRTVKEMEIISFWTQFFG